MIFESVLPNAAHHKTRVLSGATARECAVHSTKHLEM